MSKASQMPPKKAPTKKRTTSTTRKSAAKRTPAKSRSKAGASRKASSALSDLQVDLIGIGLAVTGAFAAAVIWGGWNGGPVGEALQSGTEVLVGRLVLLLPALLLIAGVVVVARESIPGGVAVKSGIALLVAGAALALTAGTFGLGSDSIAPSWSVDSLKVNGGLLGEALYAGSTALVSTLGAHLFAVFMIVAGAVLVSGVSIARLGSLMGQGAADLTRAASSVGLSRGSAKAPAKPSRTSNPKAAKRSESIVPPEPEPDELVVRSTHVEAGNPPEFEDIFDVDPFTDLPEPEVEPLDEPEDSGPAQEIKESDLTPMGRYRSGVVEDPNFKWKSPPKKLLTRSAKIDKKGTGEAERALARQLVESLGHHGVEAKLIGAVTGPHITRFELQLAPGIKMSKVANLRDDLAYALASTEIRILAPIPGKQAVGVEVPNENRQMVTLGDVWQEPPAGWSPLTVWLGKDVAGRSIGADLAKMPHLLVAGTTGAGKSGCVNAMLSSVLLRSTPKEVRLVLVDPKQVELNHYEGIPHLLTPVITNPKLAANALANLVREMESRYSLMSLARTRGLGELNENRVSRGEQPLPYILCVIDELADLMMVAPADVEDSIIRLAQKARAVGIHLVLATQSPRVDVITGMIKANVPSRIAFAVSSQTDSRVILDQNGAEALLGQGDMLFAPVGSSKLQRIQGAYIDEPQIAELCEFWKKQGEPSFDQELLEEKAEEQSQGGRGDSEFDPDDDPLLDEAIALVAQMQTASTSMMQRRLRVGYTRAGRLIDMLERRGIISGYEGSKPRQVLITEADLSRLLAAQQPIPGTEAEGVPAIGDPIE